MVISSYNLFKMFTFFCPSTLKKNTLWEKDLKGQECLDKSAFQVRVWQWRRTCSRPPSPDCGPPSDFSHLSFLLPEGPQRHLCACPNTPFPAAVCSLQTVNLQQILGSKRNCSSDLLCPRTEGSREEAATSPWNVFGADGWRIPGPGNDLAGKQVTPGPGGFVPLNG